MHNKLRIGARAQFVQIHSVPFAFFVHTLRIELIQQPIQPIRQRQYKAQKCGNPCQLRQELPLRLCVRDANCEQPQNTSDRMDRHSAARIVDGQP